MAEQKQAVESAYDWKVTGRHTVSAGAGTGKTYNIQILFLRKILDGTDIAKILVVTYTDMATAELKERLRRVLMDCRRAVRTGLDLKTAGLTAEDIVSVLQGNHADIKLDPVEKTVADYEEADCNRAQIAPFFVLDGEEGDGFIHVDEENALSLAMERLEDALRDFDQAQVSTIHGFCSRMLEVNAFESGIRYGMKVQKDMTAMYKRFRYEFWRRFCFCGERDYLRMSCLHYCGYETPEALQNGCAKLLGAMGCSIVWSEQVRALLNGPAPREAMMERVEELEDEMGRLTSELEAVVSEALTMPDNELAEWQGKLSKPWPSVLSRQYLDLCGMCPPQDVSFRLSPLTEGNKSPSVEQDFFHGGKVRKVETREAYLADNPWLASFLECVQSCLEARQEYRDCVLWLCCDWISRQVAQEKEQEGLITFDDMLLSLKEALLDRETGDNLKQVIREQFTCVMVDEAQDNDPVQTAIFNLIFGEEADRADSQAMFYMIGDPKQAIYGFRGGDVDTFIASMDQTTERNQHSLKTNYRATREYIQAMNDYFLDDEKKDRGFFVHGRITMDEIGIPEAGCDELVDAEGALVNQAELLTYGWTQEGEKPEDALAREIACLVGSGWKIRHKGEDKVVDYGDLAVLVRSNSLVESVEKALERKGIPVAKLKDSKVYETSASELILTLMHACLEINELGTVRRLLGSRFFNFSAVQLDWVLHHCLNAVQESLQELMRVWEGKTFGMMLQQFLESSMEVLLGLKAPAVWPSVLSEVGREETVQCRLLEASSGLTGLSILQQLRDVLLSVSLEQRLGPLSLSRFLEDEIASSYERSRASWGGSPDSKFVEDEEDEPEALGEKRLSSESPAVRVMSIHKSKGLEFPFVYLLGGQPDRGFSGKQADVVHVYHEDGHRCMSVTEGKELASQDDRAEGLRLLYVGITRAKCWCRWLFKAEQQKQLAPKKSSRGPSEEPVVARMRAGVPSFLTAFPAEVAHPSEERIECDVWDGLHMRLGPGWVQTSFSALSHGCDEESGAVPPELSRTPVETVMVDSRELEEKSDNGDRGEDASSRQSELWEEDWELLDPVPFEERQDIFKFPGGTRTGTCWHKMFELLPFDRLRPEVPEAEQAELWEQVRMTLENFGQLATEEQRSRFPAIQEMVRNVATREMVVGDAHLRLCDLSPDAMLREFDFTYRFRGKLSGEEFAGLLENHGIHVPVGWARGTGDGWAITGSIDMLFQNADNGKFYILDWKTNGMGGNPENFHRQGMEFEMRKHFYGLQYTLYTLAFIQYYRAITPEWTLTEESYDQLLGGCIYVFVRGVDQEDRGIYVGRPPFELMKALDEKLGVGSEDRICEQGKEA